MRNLGYYYFCDCIIQQSSNYYEDSHGNKIIGEYQGLRFAFSGFDSIIEIGESVFFQESNFYLHNNSKVMIGDHVHFSKTTLLVNGSVHIGRDCKIFGAEWKVGNDAEFSTGSDAEFNVGNRSIFQPGILTIHKKAQLSIGDDFTIGRQYNWDVNDYTSVVVGNDCMFSCDIFLLSNDGHPIYDLKTGNNINFTPEISVTRKIIIGNHVWVGMRCTILYNTRIGDGSIIGVASLVKSIMPENCVAAGSLAKVIRRDVEWYR